MNKPTLLTLFALGIFSCQEKATEHANDTPVSPVQENDKYTNIHLQFNTPTVLDSSDWVLYPLALEELEETDKGLKSSGYGRQYAYWNVAFANLKTKETRLLSDSLKMVIHTINAGDDDGSGKGNTQGLIYYSITKTDYNEDGKLTSADPDYLFVSDRSGQNFRQISPDNLTLIHWEIINPTNTVLMQAHKDSNNDKKFDAEDEIVSFIYDLEAQKLEEVFDSAFKLKAKKLLDQHWTKKK